MGSETTLKLPIIDFTNINLEANTNSPYWESVKSQVHKALVEYGCFEATFDKIPSVLRKATIAAIEELFDLPRQTKLLNLSKTIHPSHVSNPMLPLYESIAFEDGNIFEKLESKTNIFWPNGNTSFSKTMHTFSVQLTELDQIIRKMILESLSVEKYFEEHNNSTNFLVRVQKYKGPETTDTKLGLSSHTDKNFVTILYQNQVEGFEVLTKDGKWIPYKPFQDNFIVIGGDSLHALSNGRLHSPLHRVMMSGNEVRYSVGLFSLPKEGCLVKAPEELVDEEHPLLYKPFDFVKFVECCYSEKGQRDQLSLRTYCGV